MGKNVVHSAALALLKRCSLCHHFKHLKQCHFPDCKCNLKLHDPWLYLDTGMVCISAGLMLAYGIIYPRRNLP